MRAPTPLALPLAMGSVTGLALVVLASIFVRPTHAVAAPPAPTRPEGLRDPELARLEEQARAPAVDVRLAPASSSGVLGAWLLAGPFKAARSALSAAPDGVDERKLAPTKGGV